MVLWATQEKKIKKVGYSIIIPKIKRRKKMWKHKPDIDRHLKRNSSNTVYYLYVELCIIYTYMYTNSQKYSTWLVRSYGFSKEVMTISNHLVKTCRNFRKHQAKDAKIDHCLQNLSQPTTNSTLIYSTGSPTWTGKASQKGIRAFHGWSSVLIKYVLVFVKIWVRPGNLLHSSGSHGPVK